MTTVAAEPGLSVVPRRWPVAVALGRAEAWRIVRHPVALVGFGLSTLVIGGIDGDPGGAFNAPTETPTLIFGVFAFFAANLVATRDRRADGEEVLEPAPTDQLTRTLAMVFATLGPALVAAVGITLTVGAYDLLGWFEIRPTFWHLAQGPVSVLGGALLGTMVGRWAPYPGVAMVAMVAMVIWNGLAVDQTWRPLGTYMSWTTYYVDENRPAGAYLGSPAWHVAYLAALCGMAAVGALLRDVPKRLPLLTAGALLTVSAVVSGWASLP